MINYDEIHRIVKIGNLLSRLMGESNLRESSRGKFFCPVCSGNDASVSEAANVWRCWTNNCQDKLSGGKGKDAIGLFAAAMNLDRKESAKELAALYGLTIPAGRVRFSRRVSSANPPLRPQPPRHVEPWESSEWQTEATHVVSMAHERLMNHSPSDPPADAAWSYLTQNRLLNAETIALAHLGFLERTWVGANDTLSIMSGLIIPWFSTDRSQICCVNSRRPRKILDKPGPDGKIPPKYQISRGGRRRFAFPFMPAGDDIILCEGEFDTLIAIQHGLPAVTLGGCSSRPSELQRDLGKILDYKNVYIAHDNDEPGRKGAEAWREIYPYITLLNLPQSNGSSAKDLSDLAKEGVDLKLAFQNATSSKRP